MRINLIKRIFFILKMEIYVYIVLKCDIQTMVWLNTILVKNNIKTTIKILNICTAQTKLLAKSIRNTNPIETTLYSATPNTSQRYN